jgi:hypothetical protein
VVEKAPVEPGYEMSKENIAKLAVYILCLWTFFSGIYAALIFITTGMRHAPYRHLPPKYLGMFRYVGNDASKTAPTTLPALLPWVKAAMSGCRRVRQHVRAVEYEHFEQPDRVSRVWCGRTLCMNA